MIKRKKRSIISIFIGKVTKKGERNQAEREILRCIEELELRGEGGVKTFIEAVENVSPLVHMKSKRKGGTTFRIPVEISEARSNAVGIGWILENIKGKRGELKDQIYQEIVTAKAGRGRPIEKLKELHEFARKNRGLVKFL